MKLRSCLFIKDKKIQEREKVDRKSASQGSVFELTLNDHEPSSRVSQLLSINCGTAADGGGISGGLEFVPKSLAYTPDGQLILSDEKNHIYAVGRDDGRLDELAGSLSFCKRKGLES